MTNAELKKGLLKAGASAEDVKKIAETYDAEKITAIVEKAASVKAAAKEIQKLYPAISAKELQKQYHFYEEQLTGTKKKSGAKKSALKLTENELEHVAGFLQAHLQAVLLVVPSQAAFWEAARGILTKTKRRMKNGAE